MPDQVDLNEVYISNIQVPPTTTMPLHYADVNPHPQYLRVDGAIDFITSNIAMSNLKDVDINEAPANNTLLIFSGGSYKPITIDDLTAKQHIPYATSEVAGIIEVATNSDLDTANDVAVTPALMQDYVEDQIDQIHTSLNQFNTSFGSLPYATTVNSGVVYFATNEETVNGVVTGGIDKAVTPAGVKAAISNIPIATTETPGLVKTVETDNPLGKIFIADLITSNHTNGGLITSYVPQIQYNQFINVRVAEWLNDNTPDIYYSTHVGPISGDDAAEALADTNAYKVGYNVYSNGVISGRTKIGATDYSLVNITVHEQGAIYDINTKGVITILQEGIAKRLTVGDSCYAQIQGEAHNVLVSATSAVITADALGMGGFGGDLDVANHGHVTYCTVTDCGVVWVGTAWTDSTGAVSTNEAIIENVIVSDTHTSRVYGLIVTEYGKAYNVTLAGSKAHALIGGYAKDVVVHSTCCLWTSTHTKIDNLILYNGAEVKLDPGTEITGCIAYPGAVLTDFKDCSVTFNTCHEPDHTIKPVYSTCQHYSKALVPVETQPGITSNEIKLQNTYGEWYFSPTSASYDVPYRVAMLYGTSTYTQNITSSYDETVTSTGWRQIENWRTIVYATTPPRCFVRSDADKITSMNAIDFTQPDDWDTYNKLSKGAVICYPANIVNIGTPTAGGTIRYEVVPDFGPGAYHELWTQSNTGTALVRRYVTTSSAFIGDTTHVGNVEVGEYGIFETSTYSPAFHKQIQSKMFEELATPDTSIVWKVTF